MCLSKNALHTVVYVDTKDRLERRINYVKLVNSTLSVDDPWVPIYEAVNFRVSPPIWNAIKETTTNNPCQF